MNVTTKSDALAFLDRLTADPLNSELCREFGIEIVPAEPCICPRRPHCTAEIPHPACEVCDDCHSWMPATCLSDQDYEFRASDDDELPPWMLSRMGY